MRNPTNIIPKNKLESVKYQAALILTISILIIVLLGLLFTKQFNLFFAILYLIIIGYAIVRSPAYGVVLLLALSATTGFFNRLAQYFSGDLAAMDFIRAALEILIIFVTFRALLSRTIVNNRFTRQVDCSVYAYIIISTIYTFDILFAPPLVTIWGWRWVVIPILLYIVGRQIGHTEKNVERFYRMLSILLLVLSAYAVYEAITGLPGFEKYWFAQLSATSRAASTIEGSLFIAGKPRLPSMTSGPVTFTILSGYLFLLVLFTPRKYLRGGFQIVHKIALLMTGVYLLTTLERSAIAMIAIGIAVAIGLHLRWRIGKIAYVAIIFLGVVGLIIVGNLDINRIPVLMNSVALRRIVELAHPLQASTVQGRAMDVWPVVLQRFIANPFGYGLGTFHMTSQNQKLGYSFFLPPHNNYFLILLETGAIGLLSFVILVFFYYKFLFRAMRTRSNKTLIKGALASFSAVIAVGFFNIPIDPPIAYFFWFSMGLFVSFLGQENLSNKISDPSSKGNGKVGISKLNPMEEA